MISIIPNPQKCTMTLIQNKNLQGEKKEKSVVE